MKKLQAKGIKMVTVGPSSTVLDPSDLARPMLRRLALSLVRRFRLSCLTTQKLWQARRPRLDLDLLIDLVLPRPNPSLSLRYSDTIPYALCACIHSFAPVTSIASPIRGSF